MRERGFTFLEVLLAMLVLGVSVLAFAGLQVRAMETTGVAHVRSRAMTLASDLAERMRANSGEMATYREVPEAAADPGPPSTWADTCMRFIDVNSNGCSTTDMAEFDVLEVQHLARQTLPNGNVRVVQNPDADAVNWVVVAWDNQSTAACADEYAAGNVAPNCIVMPVVVTW